MTQIQQRNGLQGRSVFVSASIPDPTRWPADFRALDITDAVVAVARAVLQRGGRLVTAAHPTIAPLLLYVASETQRSSRPSVVVYQSAVFEPVLPESTRRFEADGVGELIRTPAVGDEPPDPVRATKSLPLMRRQMLTSEAPIGAVFVGGMEGISAEHEMFHELWPTAPTYAFGRPGGASRSLVDLSPEDLRAGLAESDVYPALARRVIDHLVGQVE